MAKKNIIWSNTYDAIEELKNDLSRNPDEFGLSKNAAYNEINQLVSEYLDRYYFCEKMNLDKEMVEDIVVIGTVNTWNGSHHNVSRIGNNLNMIVDSPYYVDSCEIYADRYNIRWVGFHRDGHNTALFRKMKDNSKYETFIHALMRAEAEDNTTAWNRAIASYTSSLRPAVADIYGW